MKKNYIFSLCFGMSVLLNAQNVGIGISTPVAKLQVHETATAGTEPQLRLSNPNNAVGETAGLRMITGGWNVKLQTVQAVDWFQFTDATGVVIHSMFANRFFPGASSNNNTNTGYITGNGTRVGIGGTTLAGRVFVTSESTNTAVVMHVTGNNSTTYSTVTSGGGVMATAAQNGVGVHGAHFNGVNANRYGNLGGKFTSGADHGYGVYGQTGANNFGWLGYRDTDLHIGAYGETDYTTAPTNPAASIGALGVREITNNRSIGVYGYAPPTFSAPSTWTDDFEIDRGWSFSPGNGFAFRGAPDPVDCTGSCLTGGAFSGTNVLNLRNCNNNGTSFASITLTLSAPGTFSGRYKIGSELNYDFLVYSINGAPSRTVNQIASGCNNAWTNFSFPVPAGVNTITLAYMTDAIIITDGSKVYIDDVQCTNVASILHYAGYFDGHVRITGNLSKGGGSFLIDHPDDPENKTLKHDFVESPFALNLYPGKIQLDEKGEAFVKLPSYYLGLNKEEEAIINLTCIGKKPFLTSYEWNKDFTGFTIYGEPGREVAYQVIAERDDPTYQYLKRPVEEVKSPANGLKPGTYLLPEAYGIKSNQPISKDKINTHSIEVGQPLNIKTNHKPILPNIQKISDEN